MRFSAITTLCAAPLALAGTLQAELAARNVVGLEAESIESSNNRDSSNSRYSNFRSNDNNNNDVSLTDVIIIWVNLGGGAPTQTLAQTSTVTATTTVNVNGGANTGTSTAAAAAGVQTHTVTVGGPAGLVYTPDSITAAVGDMVIFTFLEQNHTATQSAFTTPCEALAGGMDSGFMANINSTVSPAPQMAMQVAVATPLWFYCKQKGHCGKGMTFSINPTLNKTQAMFQQMAIAQNGTGSTAVIAGGAAAGGAAAGTASTTLAAAGSAATSSSSTGSIVAGTGSTDSTGACQCSCLCGAASFPSANQGIDAFGGVPGAMPMAALMAAK